MSSRPELDRLKKAVDKLDWLAPPARELIVEFADQMLEDARVAFVVDELLPFQTQHWERQKAHFETPQLPIGELSPERYSLLAWPEDQAEFSRRMGSIHSHAGFAASTRRRLLTQLEAYELMMRLADAPDGDTMLQTMVYDEARRLNRLEMFRESSELAAKVLGIPTAEIASRGLVDLRHQIRSWTNSDYIVLSTLSEFARAAERAGLPDFCLSVVYSAAWFGHRRGPHIGRRSRGGVCRAGGKSSCR
ncbi:MAG: hypothetical protein QM775_24375 [Pirellulales bacterium]